MTTLTRFEADPVGELYPLYQLTQAVAAAREPEEIFDAALACLAATLGVERSSVLLFDHAGVMRFRAWRGLSDGYRAAVDGHSPWTPETTDAAPVLVPDVREDAGLAGLRGVIEGERIRALAFIPLAIGTRLLGKFMLYYAEPHLFDEREVLIAQTVASHVAFAIDQRAHRDSEARYRQLLDSVGVAVYTTDATGLITYYNDEAAKLWGRAPAVGVERWVGAWRLYHADGSPMPHEECPMALTIKERRAVRGYELICERPDGTRVHFVPFPTPIADREGNLTGAVNVLMDISARKDAEAALAVNQVKLEATLAEKEALLAERDRTIGINEATQAQLALLIEASRALIGPQGKEGAVAKILGIARELLGADAYALWEYVDERGQWEIVFWQGLSDEYVASAAIRDPSGRRELARPLVVEDVEAEPQLALLRERYTAEGVRSMFVAPITRGDGASGTLVFYYHAPHRFSELEVRVGISLAHLASASLTAARLFEQNERARQDLVAANAAKDEFLGLVSHELKTPVTAILGNAYLLDRRYGLLTEEDRRSAARDVLHEASRLDRVVDDLLTLARLERGRLEREPVALTPVVRSLLKDIAPGREVTATVEPEARNAIAFASENLVGQVLRNYVNNACKYSAEGSPVEVRIERRRDEALVRVLDRGIGVDAEEVDALFEPFYRSAQHQPSVGGLGIGLAVCRRLIEAMGGRVWASPREGGGSEFGFALQLFRDDPG
ncbi:MAG TPA: ATP-binding protein [Dehalococcoidia bacterium]|nr:ATP-binding protein [Dehalococcoidia bacterium]